MTPDEYRATAPRKKRNDDAEYRLHCSIVDWLWTALPDGCGVQWEHYPAGGKRNLFAAMKFKRMGTKPGRLDLRFRWNLILVPSVRMTGWLEIKCGSELSESQEKFMQECRALGDLVAVARSRIEAYEILSNKFCLPLATTIDANDIIRNRNGGIVRTGKNNYTPPLRVLKKPGRRAIKAAMDLYKP